MSFPNIEDIARVAAIENPIERNAQITESYHELALVLAGRTGGKANWCSFATWASLQAGQTIRKEDLARTLQAELGFSSQSKAQQAIKNIISAAGRIGASIGAEKILTMFWKAYDPQSAFDRSSAAVAHGNLKVFAEIAHQFARFYLHLSTDGAYSETHLSDFLSAFQPGEPPDGQDLLRSAFQHYYQALFEPDDKKQTEMLLLANLEIGLHEQTRLQPQIVEALEAPVVEPQVLATKMLNELRPGSGWLAIVGWNLLRFSGKFRKFELAVDEFTAEVRQIVQAIVTDTMMTIDLPGYPRLHLGEDLPIPFPPSLVQLNNPDLLALLGRIDPTPNSTDQSGAEMWGNFPDRIHFIADMFRCFALMRSLHNPVPIRQISSDQT